MPQQIDVPGMGVVEFPDGMSDDQIASAIRGNMSSQSRPAFNPETGARRVYIDGKPPTASPVPDQPDTLTDVAKSTVSGLANGVINVAGALPDISATLHSAANRFIFDPVFNAISGPPAGGSDQRFDINKALGSSSIKNAIEGVTGEFYEPKTVAGEFAHTAGELAPAMFGGPESILTKLTGRVAVPALVGEGLHQLTKGTPIAPFAKAAGTLLGGYGAYKALAPKGVPAPTADELLSASKQAYKHPEVAALELHPSSTAYTASKIADGLNKGGFRKLTAPQTFGLVNELRSPLGKTAKVADIQSVRTALGKVAGNFSNPVEQAAASQAIRGIDDYLANLKPFDVAVGNGKRAAEILKEARGNYAAAKRVQRTDDAEFRAELNAASAHSGGNINNATRQALKSILISPAKRRGFSPEELSQMEAVVRGTATGNVMRAVGKLLATNGMAGAGLIGGSAALAPLTNGLSLAAPVVGYAARKMGDRSTANAIRELDRMIAMRSPLGQSLPSAAPSTKPLVAGLLSGIADMRAERLRSRSRFAE